MNFQMSEINLRQSGQCFSELFFVTNFATDNYQTLILPKGYFSKVVKNLEKVYLESPVFHSFFDVYSNSQLQARLILQTDIMDKLNNFAKRYPQKIYLSFTNNQLMTLVEFDGDVFEPKTFGPEKLVDLVQFVDILNLITDLIETLKLKKTIKK